MNKNLFPWQIRDEHAGAMLELLDVIQLERSRVVFENQLLEHAFDLGFLVRFRENIPDQRPR